MSQNASFSRPLAAVALLLAFTSAPAALAQTGAQPENAQAMADVRFKAGLAAYDKGDYEAARLEFLQAQAIFPRPSLLRNLALSELHTGRPLDALVHFRVFIADSGTTPDKRALAERSLGEAYAQTGHLSITAPPGAHLKVDGKDVGIAPLAAAIDVVIGLHSVDAEANAGAVTAHESVEAGAGKLTEVAFVQSALGDAKMVSLRSQKGGAAGGAAVPADESYWNGRRTIGVVIAGVGVAGLAVGGVFGAARGGTTSDANMAIAQIGSSGSACDNPKGASLMSACSSLASARSSNGSDATLEGVFLIGGGVLLAAGVVTTLWPAAARAAKTGLAPMTGPHTAGLQWAGSF